MTDSNRPPAALAGSVLAVTGAATSCGLVGWWVATELRGEPAVPWVLARACGVACYVLLVALVATGLAMAHPWSRRAGGPGPELRLTVHATLATFTLAFTALHVVVLATDPWAHVGWAGALLPFGSQYRPVAVTLGVLALWAGLVTWATARLAGRVAGRVWWPVHKVAATTLALAWAHGVLAGTDAAALRWFYVSTGLGVVGLAVSRYTARTPADGLAELTRGLSVDGPREVQPQGAGLGR